MYFITFLEILITYDSNSILQYNLKCDDTNNLKVVHLNYLSVSKIINKVKKMLFSISNGFV